MLESTFLSEPFDGKSFVCEIILSSTVNGVYSELLEEFSKNAELKNAASCIVENLRVSKWSDLDLKEQIYEVSELLTKPERDQKIRDIRSQKENISDSAIVSCLAEREFGELFDSIFGNVTQDDEEDFVGDYCARKYGIENGLIDRNEYNVQLNTKNISTVNIDCDKVNESHFLGAESELRKHLLLDVGESQDKVDCYIKKYHDNHYFDNTLTIALLSELNVTEAQRHQEKNKFVKKMINITKVISEC